MERTPILVVAGLLLVATFIAAWPSGGQPFWKEVQGLASALVPVLSAMFGALLAVHGYEVREGRALRRRLIEQMFRAGRLLTARLYSYHSTPDAPNRAAAGDRVNDALVDLAMYVRLYGKPSLNDYLSRIENNIRGAGRPVGPESIVLKKLLEDLAAFSDRLVELSSDQFKDERIG